ncbi:MAG: hypothetical protein AAGJ46_03655 [Planctomycetota bacterium]
MSKPNLAFSIAAAACAVALGPAPYAAASILDDFNAGEIVGDFLFEDPAGTALTAVANSADPAAPFDFDSDSGDVVTNGLGQLDLSPKANTSFGSNYADFADASFGRFIALMDLTWAFDELVYDPSQDEEVRVSLIRDPGRSSFVTGELYFQRTAADELTLFGNAVGTGAVDTADTVFGSSGSILALLDVNLDTDTMEIFYSDDDGVSFTSGGTGLLDPSRGIAQLRLVTNEDFSDDSVLIERVAVSFIVPEPASAVVLLVGLIAGTRPRR